MRALIWRLILLAPLLVVLILFALSNTQSVRIGLWPTEVVVEAPLSLAILVAMGVAFLVGALAIWIVGLGTRMRARRAEQAVSALRNELQALNTRMARAAAGPTTTLLPPARGGR